MKRFQHRGFIRRGQQIGDFIALGDSYSRNAKGQFNDCECATCHTKYSIRTSFLLSGEWTECGKCRQKKRAKGVLKKYQDGRFKKYSSVAEAAKHEHMSEHAIRYRASQQKVKPGKFEWSYYEK